MNTVYVEEIKDARIIHFKMTAQIVYRLIKEKMDEKKGYDELDRVQANKRPDKEDYVKFIDF